MMMMIIIIIRIVLNYHCGFPLHPGSTIRFHMLAQNLVICLLHGFDSMGKNRRFLVIEARLTLKHINMLLDIYIYMYITCVT